MNTFKLRALTITVMVRASSFSYCYGQSQLFQLQVWSEPSLAVTAMSEQALAVTVMSEPSLAVTVM